MPIITSPDDILHRLEEAARSYDAYLSNTAHMNVHAAYGDVRRDVEHPSMVGMSDEKKKQAMQQGWYMAQEELCANSPPEFVALDGSVIKKSETGYTNPYGPTGLTGPGVLGFGRTAEGHPVPENRAVDIVIQFIDPKDGKLKFIGGVRGDTKQPCFVGGFQEKDALESAVREFIEEGISGSIELRYAAPALYALCEQKMRGGILSGQDEQILSSFGMDPHHFSGDIGEAAYHFIQKEDPAFVESLKHYFKDQLSVAYQGPCRADPRTTDQRWIATTLLTGLIDLDEVNALLAAQKFPYRFAAGSDLDAVNVYEFSPAFVTTAFASHGPLVCLATAHNLKKMDDPLDALREQCDSVMAAINNHMSSPCVLRPQASNVYCSHSGVAFV